MNNLDKFLKDKQTHKGFKEEKDPDIIGLDINIMRQDYEHGVQTAETTHIPQMDEHYKNMRGHQNCWTGYPNEGKTAFKLYLDTVKAVNSNWKFVYWSPEMKGANFVDGKVKVHYNSLAYDIMTIKTGKTPYKHIHEKFNVPLMELEEIENEKEWIDEKFIFLNPRKKDIDSIYELLRRIYYNEGYDSILIDPFKNIEPDPSQKLREDQHLHKVFSKFKEFAIETNTVMNWIAHPKSNVSRVVSRKGEDVLQPCNQYMLAGGAAWDNSMDGIYSIHRPDLLMDISSRRVTFFNLKQRMQNLVAPRGSVDNIEYDIKTSRYTFNGYSPFGFKKYDLPEDSNKFDLF